MPGASPALLAPEQASGAADLDDRTDIYALGAILYSILTLQPPVEGKTIDEMLAKVTSGNIRPPTECGRKTGRRKADLGPGAKDDGQLKHLPRGEVPAGAPTTPQPAFSDWLRRITERPQGG